VAKAFTLTACLKPSAKAGGNIFPEQTGTLVNRQSAIKKRTSAQKPKPVTLKIPPDLPIHRDKFPNGEENCEIPNPVFLLAEHPVFVAVFLPVRYCRQ
jgi:hypothetical protein